MVKAVIARFEGAPVEVIDVALPEVGPHEVRVKIVAAGVCHSDLSMVTGTISPRYPVVLGHEASGRITAIGSEIDDLAVGDPVVLNWAAPCRRCWNCLHGEPWLCRQVEGVVSRPSRITHQGEQLELALGVGAFIEETVLPRSAVVRLPEGVPMDVGAVMGCAVLTGMGAALNTAEVRAGDSVLVLGLGGVGLSAIAGAKLAGATSIIAVDTNPEKETDAREMGATDFFTWSDDLPRTVRKLTGRRGVDHAFECVGKPATIRASWASTRRGGTCVIVGVGRTTDEVTFNAMELYHFGRNLTSSVFGSSDAERDIPVLAAQVTSGAVDLARLITHHDGLGGVADAFDRMTRGEGIRTVIEP